MTSGSFRYVPLMLFQLILMVLYFVFVKFPAKPENGIETQKSFDGFEDTHVMIFIGFGFLMTFLKKYCYSALGFNWLLAALVIQWALLCQNFFHMENNTIIITKKLLFEADVMAATVLITFGALLGIASDLQLLFIAIIETVVGCVNIFIVSDVLKAADIGGSIAIHSFGAYFGLGVSMALRIKKDTTPAADGHAPQPTAELNGASYVSDVTAMIGSIFLWIYWPSFNSGLADNVTESQRAIANTYLSLAAATVTTFFLSAVVSHEGKLDMVHIQNSTLAGGVAVGSVCNMFIGGGGAIAVGIGAGIMSVLGYKFLTPALAKIGILDTCGVNNLHGMPGLYSGLLSVLFAALATKESYGSELETVFPAMAGNGRSASDQALYQLGALGSTLGIALVTGFITGTLSRIFVCKPLKETERYNDELNWELP